MKSFTGKNLRAKIAVAVLKRASKYLPTIQIVKGDPASVVKIPSMYSDSKMGFGCKLERK